MSGEIQGRTRKSGRGPLLTACLLALLLIPAAQAAPGALDPSFGAGGKVTTAIGASSSASALLLQPDGKLVAAGASNDGSGPTFALARYKPNGSLDTGFGSGGKVTTAFGSNGDQAYGVIRQGDGKLVAAGFHNNGSSNDFALARYNADGSLDGSFGGGKVTTSFGSGNDDVSAVAQQPDGKLVAAGSACGGGQCLFAVARYNPNGSLDTGFNGTGMVTTAFGPSDDEGDALVLQPDGKLVVAGLSQHGPSWVFALARYNPNGSLDTSFNATGKVTTAFGSIDDEAYALVLQPDGKLVAAGYSYTGAATTYDLALARYNSDGSLDTSFGGTGKVTTAIVPGSEEIDRLVLQPDGKLVASGYADTGTDNDFALARYNPDGSLDKKFGGTGKVTTPISSGDDAARALVLQPDGKLVAAGFSKSGSQFVFALARYLGKPLCVVPKLKGKRLTAAKKALKSAHCSVGKVTRAFSATLKKGRVISQKPKPGAKRPSGSKVNLKVSKGKKT
jgi:uncharacterized delta-60 repeat protein